MEILTILKANIKHKRGAFKSIVVFMMIISMVITAILSLSENIDKNLKNAHKNVGSGDFVSYISEEKFTADIEKNIMENENVEKIKAVQTLYVAKHDVEGEGNGNAIFLTKWEGAYPVYNEKCSDFIDNKVGLQKGEIYVPLAYQSLYDCKIGDNITIATKNGDEKYRIKGFMEEPFNGASLMGIKQVCISADDFDRMYDQLADEMTDAQPLIIKYYLVHVYRNSESTLSDAKFKKDVNETSKILDNSFVTLSLSDSIHYTEMMTDIGSGILFVFIILMTLIVLIIISHSIATSIEMDYVNLGILKSQGFTKGKIRQIFILQYEIAQLLGAVIGIVIAIPLTKLLGDVFQPITGIHATADIAIAQSLLLNFGILVLGGIFVLVKTAKIAKISPVRAISGGREVIYFDSRINMPIGKKFLSGRLALRQFTSNKRQYIGTILIVSILVFFMMSMTILAGSMTSESVSESFGVIPADVSVTLTNSFDMSHAKDIETEISHIAQITSVRYHASEYLTLNGTDLYCTFLDSGEGFTSVFKGRAPLYDNEILITEIVADELDLKMGDKVLVSGGEQEAEYLITGFYQTTNDAGRTFAMTFDGGNKVGIKRPESILYMVEDTSKIYEIVDCINEIYGETVTASAEDSNSMAELIEIALTSISAVIYVISIFFILVVVNMVCSKTFLKERQDIGIFKALGFAVKDLRLQFAIRFFIVSIIGSVIGVALSVLCSSELINQLMRQTGVTNFKTDYTIFTIAAPTTLVCLCFFVFSYIASRKVKSVVVRELVTE
ncbi:ABC transporter permease [Anaerosporobacter sp.]|uniref:ABC transporter permease n=1 Tax=Anaerosporobacter sp. TaxID=1872529 RepID=UPI00286ED098|nr:FtsX-like permease family protein [Anaerosporobacter sp.]